jgi:hypothetical protein
MLFSVLTSKIKRNHEMSYNSVRGYIFWNYKILTVQVGGLMDKNPSWGWEAIKAAKTIIRI